MVCFGTPLQEISCVTLRVNTLHKHAAERLRRQLQQVLCGASVEVQMSDLEVARAFAKAISESLPSELYVGSLTLNSKLPFKAFEIRELLIHRASDLANGAINIFDEEMIVPAIVLVRSLIETTALLYSLYERTQGFLIRKDVAEYDQFLMSCLVGSRDKEAKYQSINVLNHIDRFERLVPGFRQMYDSLSEYAHPNWAGLKGAYGTTDKEKYVTRFGTRSARSTPGVGVAALAGTLLVFHHYYNALGVELEKVNSHFDGAA